LTRGRVCRLQLLLAFASTVILGSESRRTRDHILLSQMRDIPFRHLLRLAGLRWRYSTPLHTYKSFAFYSNIQSQSQSYITTDGQSASLSWNKAPIWGLRPDLYYCQPVPFIAQNLFAFYSNIQVKVKVTLRLTFGQ
jgi:hypothetical protein